MSLHDYEMSLEVSKQDYPFYALIMAAIRQADTENTDALKRAFPETCAEFMRRYHAPNGILPEEEATEYRLD